MDPTRLQRILYHTYVILYAVKTQTLKTYLTFNQATDLWFWGGMVGGFGKLCVPPKKKSWLRLCQTPAGSDKKESNRTKGLYLYI